MRGVGNLLRRSVADREPEKYRGPQKKGPRVLTDKTVRVSKLPLLYLDARVDFAAIELADAVGALPFRQRTVIVHNGDAGLSFDTHASAEVRPRPRGGAAFLVAAAARNFATSYDLSDQDDLQALRADSYRVLSAAKLPY